MTYNFLEGTCIDLSALHRSVYKQNPKERENYKEVQNYTGVLFSHACLFPYS
jgi:hypothetical protein